jgi:hypothetical protein
MFDHLLTRYATLMQTPIDAMMKKGQTECSSLAHLEDVYARLVLRLGRNVVMLVFLW